MDASPQDGIDEAVGGPQTDRKDTVFLERNDIDRRINLVIAHFLVGTGVLTLWGAADAWQAATGLGLAKWMSVATALPAGVVVSTLIHEWMHFAGARAAGAVYGVPDKLGLFVFNYDFARNDVQQFFLMSYGGQLGGLLSVLLLWWALPMDTAGRVMLVCAAIGAVVFAACIEWPVLQRTRVSGAPARELGKITRQTVYRAGSWGAAAAVGLWLVFV